MTRSNAVLTGFTIGAVFFAPFYTAVGMLLWSMYLIYKKYDLVKAITVAGIPLAVVLADNLATGRQDYFRATVFAYQAIILTYLYRR